MAHASISPHTLQELERPLAQGHFDSLDDLIWKTLRALDDSQAAGQECLERELIKGIEGTDSEMTSSD